MIANLEAAEETLQLGLEKLKQRCDAAARWLQRLDDPTIGFSDPSFTDHVNTDPMLAATQAAQRAMGKHLRPAATDDGGRRKVYARLTAIWSLQSKSADEVLVFWDRIKFEAHDITGAPTIEKKANAWDEMENAVEQFVTSLGEQTSDARTPKFLFISQLTDQGYQEALSKAIPIARENAAKLAQAEGKQLDSISYLSGGLTFVDSHLPEAMMQRQSCLSLLANSSYDLQHNETASDNADPVRFDVQVHVSYHMK
jgi:hypothetical protein